MRRMNRTQRKWLEENEGDISLVKKWVSKGEPYTIPLIHRETGERSYGAACRGVRMSDCDGPTPDGVMKNAKSLLEKFAEDTKDVPEIDERALHIDGEVIDLSYRVADAGFRIDRIMFLGSMTHDEGVTCEGFEDFYDRLTERGAVHESLKELADAAEKAEGGSEEDDDDDVCPADRDEKISFFLQEMEDLGYYGFVLEISYPVGRNHSFDENGHVTSYSCSWGWTHTTYVYGDDMSQAIERAGKEVERWKKIDEEASLKKKKEKKD